MCDDIRRSFGRAVFGDEVMKERLPEAVYAAIKKTMDGGRRLDPSVASEVARAMKEWALELGATHFTHW
ncbi:MAG: glutamine synthetase III, partial [Clostridia bacterium]|nr:glutamine synthetase III [Clostridia bacterium]